MATKTATKETKPVRNENEYEGQEAVTSILQDLGKLSYEERQQFSRRFNDVFNQENDKKSQGKDFDTEGYY